MPESIELHDSTLGAIVRDGTDLIVQLTPAYVHRSQGLPGQDPGSGWSVNVNLRIGDAAAQPNAPVLPFEVSDGTLTLGDRTLENMVPLPLCVDDRVRMVLMLVSGEQVELTGNSLVAEVAGAYEYIEEFR